MEGVGHNIPNIDGLDSIIRREPPSPVSEWVSFAPSAEAHKQRAWHAANVLCKMKRSKGRVAALVLLSELLQNSVAEV